MTETHSTDITMIVDRSTSMTPYIKETIEGYNKFLDEQKKVPGKAVISLVTFQSEVEPVYVAKPIQEAPELTVKTYRTDGWTAMNDAIGVTIQKIGNRLDALEEVNKPDKVIVVIITDGEENRSQEFAGVDGYNRVAEMIEHQQNRYNWQFLFLGANIDVSKVAGGLRIAHSAQLHYAHDAKGVQDAYVATSRAISENRSASLDSAICFDDEDRKKQNRTSSSS
jgi:uncharacterized protein YegL